MVIQFVDGTRRVVDAVAFGKSNTKDGKDKLHVFYTGSNGLLLKRVAKDIANISK